MHESDRAWMEHIRRARDTLLAQGVPYPETMRRLAHWVSSARWGDHRAGTPGRGRKSVKTGVRQQAFERDGYRCRLCGGHRQLTLHHEIARSAGGADTVENLITLCLECHRLVETRRDLVKLLRAVLLARVSVQGLEPGITIRRRVPNPRRAKRRLVRSWQEDKERVA